MQWFASIDSNRDGLVSAPELQRSLSIGGLHYSLQQVSNMVRCAQCSRADVPHAPNTLCRCTRVLTSNRLCTLHATSWHSAGSCKTSNAAAPTRAVRSCMLCWHTHSGSVQGTYMPQHVLEGHAGHLTGRAKARWTRMSSQSCTASSQRRSGLSKVTQTRTAQST